MLREKSCGIVPYREVQGEIRYLVISSAVTKREHWEFPKGGVEAGEREIDTALRELWEETGVKDVRVLPGYREPIRYIYRRPEGLVSKQVVYFIARVGDPSVKLREVEAKDYRWADYDEARKLLRHANARALLERCHAFITGKPVPGAAAKKAGQVRPAPIRPGAARRQTAQVAAGRAAEQSPAEPAKTEAVEAKAPQPETARQAEVAAPEREGGRGGRGRRRRGRPRNQREASRNASRSQPADEGIGRSAERTEGALEHTEAVERPGTRQPGATARSEATPPREAPAPRKEASGQMAEPSTGRRRRRRRGRRGASRQPSAPGASAPPEPSARPGSRSNA